MDWADIPSYVNKDAIVHLLQTYKSYGPLPGILLTFIEAFIPPLPLLLLVAANAAAYGLWLGFACSWIGGTTGAVVVYLLFRRIAERPLILRWTETPHMQKTIAWLRRGSFGYVFILSALPIGPSALVNIAAGIARMPMPIYFMAMTAGKTVMVLLVSLLGYDAAALIRSPLKLAIIASFIGTLWFAGKLIEGRLTR